MAAPGTLKGQPAAPEEPLVELPSRTVEAADEEAARRLGARELGVPEEDVRPLEVSRGLWHVQALRVPATIEVAVRPGEQEALVTRVAPPTGDAPPVTRDDVEAALAQVGVVAGLLLDEIDALVARVAGGEEARDVVVARGSAPEDGANGAWVVHANDDALVRTGERVLERRAAEPGTPGGP